MTPPNPPHARVRHHRRILAAATAAVAAVVMITGVPPTAAAARIAGDHHSVTVTERANAALAAHDTFFANGTPASFVAYLAARDATADAVAWEMRLDPGAVRTAWAKADPPHQEAVLAALAQLGKPYRYATSDPDVGFDCSGLTAYAWQRAGLEIPHQSSAQIDAAAARDQATAVAGDIGQYPGHVMLYLGVGDAIVHAANHRSDVELSFASRAVRYGDPEG